jgi:hypothetical protein
MDDNENLVLEDTEVLEGAENTETTAVEETVGEQVETPAERTFTQTQFNDAMRRRLARQEAQIRKKYEEKYGHLENVLKAGTGKESVEEVTDTFEKFYQSKGIKIPRQTDYSDKDVELLANAEANEVIRSGYEDVVDELNRLTDIGVANMTAREKAYFKALAEHRQGIERQKELTKIGVTDAEYNSKDFQDFKSKFNPNTPIREIFDLYNKMKPKKEIRTAGSMKQTQVNSGVKDFYTEDEISRLTEEDLKNPKVWDAVRRSMTGG